MRIYIITGKAETGKSTLGGYLKEYLKEKDFDPCVMQITAPLYHFAEDYFNWDKKSNEKPREFLQNLGIEVIRNELHKKDFLMDRLVEDIDILKEFFDTFIITDVRLPEEVERLRKEFKDVVLIKVIRDNYINTLTNEERNHITETEVDKIDNLDYEVHNTSLKDLKLQAKQIIDKEEKELII